MQNPENFSFPSMSELELCHYLAAAAATEHGGEGFSFPGMGNNGGNDSLGGIIGGGNYCSSISMSGSSCASFYPGAAGMVAETTESKAIAASRVLHKEAEKRRRERINSHLDRLRCLLPCTSKTDKATLLSKVVQRVAELTRQAAELPPLENLMIPSETDEFAVDIYDNNDFEDYGHDHGLKNNDDGDDDSNNNNNNRIILKASLCCEDRPDLFADLSQVLSSLNLKTLRAEMSTLGGRIQGVLVVSGDHNKCQRDECVVFLRDALKGIVQRSGSDDRLKRRRRVFDHPNC